MQTITRGARTKKLACVALVLSALAAAAGSKLVELVSASPQLKLPFVSLCAAMAFSLVFFAWPHHIASAYVSKSLADDMKDPVARYVESSHAGNFWVAYDTIQKRVVGSVALEPPQRNETSASNVPSNKEADPHSPWDAASGDGELRRMSVAPSHRGRGISKQLFNALWTHAKASKKFLRIVLSTSEMQSAACRLYPTLGFQIVKTVQLPSSNLPLIDVFYFSKKIPVH